MNGIPDIDYIDHNGVRRNANESPFHQSSTWIQIQIESNRRWVIEYLSFDLCVNFLYWLNY